MNDETRMAVGEPLASAKFKLTLLVRGLEGRANLDTAIVTRKVREIKALLELALLKLGGGHE